MEIKNNQINSRWEVTLDGEVVGFAAYKSGPDKIVFTHTQVDAGHEGKGMASKLARAALDDAIAHGQQISILCPFIRSYVDRHPEYAKFVEPPKPKA